MFHKEYLEKKEVFISSYNRQNYRYESDIMNNITEIYIYIYIYIYMRMAWIEQSASRVVNYL